MARVPESLYRPVPEFNPSHIAVAPKLKTPKPPAKVTFEEAMQWLRRGAAIRRRAWAKGSSIFAVLNNVYVQLPGSEPGNGFDSQYRKPPTIWRPYPGDFFADDWERA